MEVNFLEKSSCFIRKVLLGSRPTTALFGKQVLAKFVYYKFFNNFIYSNIKKFLKIFKLYTLKYSKIYTFQNFFLQFLQ